MTEPSDKYATADMALADVTDILTALERKFPPGHRSRVRGIVSALNELRSEMHGPRVRFRRYVQGTLVEVITGRLLSAYTTSQTITLLTDDGTIHDKYTGEIIARCGSWDLEPIEGARA